jgi:hypothetical protein
MQQTLQAQQRACYEQSIEMAMHHDAEEVGSDRASLRARKTRLGLLLRSRLSAGIETQFELR